MIYFTHDELVPPEIAKKGAGHCFGLFYAHFLKGIDQLRDDLKFPLFVNDWAIGGKRTLCGYRQRSCSIGAPASFHKCGGALDLHTRDDAEMRDLVARILKFPSAYAIRRMENQSATPGWLHVDCKEHARPGIHIFSP